MLKGGAMRSMFFKELQRNQEVFVNSRILSGRGNPAERFYCRYMEIPVAAKEDVYQTWKTDTEILFLLHYVSHKLGIFLSLSDLYLALHVRFPYNGFFCCRDFYGELRRQVIKRLQFEFGNKILLDDSLETVYIGRHKKHRKKGAGFVLDDLDLR